jgi:hypothetical protein
MSQEEYRSLALTAPPAPPTNPRIEDVDGSWEVGPHTDPPSARRSESLAKMRAYSALTPPIRRPTDPPFGIDFEVPRPPLVPMLSLPSLSDPHASSPERLAVSTDRPTALGAHADLADRTRVLRQAVSKARLAELTIDHRAGFILSLIDGTATIEEVLDMCPLGELEALSVLADLVRRGIVVASLAGAAGRSIR